MNPKRVENRALMLLREKMIATGINIASQPHARTLSLDVVAEALDAHPDDVAMLFSSDAEFMATITERISMHFNYYVDKFVNELAEIAVFEERVMAIAQGYFEFTQREKDSFGAFTSMFAFDQRMQTFDDELCDDDFHPLLKRVLILVRDEIRLLGGPQDLWLLESRAYSIFAAIHGISHLASFGLVRFFNDTAKRRVLNAVMCHIMAGVGDSLQTGRYLMIEPNGYIGSTDFPPVLPAQQMPRSTDKEIVQALFRGAIEDAVTHGVAHLTIEKACERSGVPLDVARKLLKPDVEFDQQLKDHLDHWVKNVTVNQMKALGAGAPTIAVAKCTGLGYVASAMIDPDGLEIFVTLSNASIVPSAFEDDPMNANMGDTFRVLLTLTRAGIVEGGGDPSPWLLFENTLNVWAVSHGLANAFSSGPLRNLSKDYKFAMLNDVITLSTGSVVERLGLQLPGVTEHLVTS